MAVCVCLANTVVMPYGSVCLRCGRKIVRKSLSIVPVLEEAGTRVDDCKSIVSVNFCW